MIVDSRFNFRQHFAELRLDRAFRGHRGPVTCIAFHPQEQQVPTARYAARVARVCTMLDADSQIVSVKLQLVACCNICQILLLKVTLKLHCFEMVRFLNPKSYYNRCNHAPGCLRLSGRMFVRLALNMDSHKSNFTKDGFNVLTRIQPKC